MTDTTPNIFDAEMAAALDRFDAPPLSLDFADRVMAALDTQIQPLEQAPSQPPLPKIRPSRDRRFGWARRRVAAVSATLALGVASMSAAATGLLTDFGIRIPVVTDYVTKHLGIKPVHLWHHAPKPDLHKAAMPAHIQVIHSDAPLPAAQIPMPTPAQIVPATIGAPTASPAVANRRTMTSGAVVAGGGALAIARLVHRPAPLPVHPQTLRADPAWRNRQPMRVQMAEPAALGRRENDVANPLQPRSEAGIRHEPAVPQVRLTPAPIGSVGHPSIPDEIIQLHTPEERAAERAAREHSDSGEPRSGADRQASAPRDNVNPRQRQSNADRRADTEQGRSFADTPPAHQSGELQGETAEKSIRSHPNADHPAGQNARRAKPARPFVPHAIRQVHTRR